MKKIIDEKYYGLLVSGAIFVVFLGYFTYASRHKSPRINKAPIKQVTGKIGAKMSIRKQNDRSIVGVGDQFDIVLSIDSKGEPVYGFDSVIKFDSDVLKYNGVRGTDPNFDFVASVKNDELIVTGILKTNRDPVKLLSTPLATLSFTAAKKGNSNMELVMEKAPSTSDSNILDGQSQDIIGEIEDVPVLVGNKFIITNTNVNKIGDFDVELLEVRLPPQGCVDCASSATIRVSDKTRSDKLTLSTGGVAGSIHNSQEVFEVIYEAESITDNQIILYYAPISL